MKIGSNLRIENKRNRKSAFQQNIQQKKGRRINQNPVKSITLTVLYAPSVKTVKSQ
jgi:hypothetical protein